MHEIEKISPKEPDFSVHVSNAQAVPVRCRPDPDGAVPWHRGAGGLRVPRGDDLRAADAVLCRIPRGHRVQPQQGGVPPAVPEGQEGRGGGEGGRVAGRGEEVRLFYIFLAQNIDTFVPKGFFKK